MIAAVIVRWRGGDEVDRCLRSLVDHGGPRLSRVVLVDSGSGDGGAERLAGAFPHIDVVALSDNLSFAHAANRGIAVTDETSVLLLNPDTELCDDALTVLADELDERPRAAGVVPLLLNRDGSAQHRWQLRRLPTVARLAVGRPGAPCFRSPPARVVAVPQPAAAAWMVRRDVWNALDGFDETFAPAWWEDVDFCARLDARLGDPGFPADHGFLVVPHAQVIHQGGSSLGRLSDTEFVIAYHTNLIRYGERHHPQSAALISRVVPWSLAARSLVRPAHREAYRTASHELGLNNRNRLK